MVNLKFRPYARLLTMLGDQLIKDEIIALIELIKNSYDADAEQVTVEFKSFSSQYTNTNESYIVIEDDGNGMDEDILKNSWMNPATPEKLKRKRINSYTGKGRIMQGEKGIGRFAIFKLGRKIQIITRRQARNNDGFIDAPESAQECVLTYDFSGYDNEFLSYNNTEADVFLDDLTVTYESRDAEVFVEDNEHTGKKRKPFGTRIVISELLGSWDRNKIEKVNKGIFRMQPIFGDVFEKDFTVNILVNDQNIFQNSSERETLLSILDDKSVFIVEGGFDAEKRTIDYQLDNHSVKMNYSYSLNSPEMLGIKPLEKYLDSLKERQVECGSFTYKFYILDLDVTTRDKNTKYYLDRDEKQLLKEHRVYLYRDGIRVMPYGDAEDDWLRLDVIRGTERSGSIFGNDQIVGYIKISQAQNPRLKDKTNREGLIEDGYAREDLVSICQLLLRYLRGKDFAQYLIEKSNRKLYDDEKVGKPYAVIEKARSKNIGKLVVRAIQKGGDEAENAGAAVIDGFIDDFEKSYRKEVEVLEKRITTSENLAAIGLSAETAYHDARILLLQIQNSLNQILQKYRKNDLECLNKENVLSDIEPIKSQIDTVAKLMNNVQRLFPSTKNKKKQINVYKLILQVRDLYSDSLKKNGIRCEIKDRSDGHFLVECTDAVLFQVFINLFDNSLYWLKTVDDERSINVVIDADQRMVQFADSGPGIKDDDIPYIFEAFYSGKGEDGKGLGLYIARQLLSRYNAEIRLVDQADKKSLRGANFLIQFAESGAERDER